MDSLCRRLMTDGSSLRVFAGFDGFVDEIVHVVDKRTGPDSYERLEYMGLYAERIARAAGLSTNIEMVTIAQKLGGNGAIFADALSRLGAETVYIGALGRSEPYEVFADMAARCRLIGIAEPAHTDAVEFLDGKIISSKLAALEEVNVGTIKSTVGNAGIRSYIEESDLVCFANWTMLSHMNGIWRYIIDDIMPDVTGDERILYIDLADPEKRSREDILEALELIKEFSQRFRVVLGMNEKETAEIADVLELDGGAAGIREALGIYCAVSHPVKSALAACSNGVYEVQGPYCERPLITTGAGDCFNAGFCLALGLGYDIVDALTCGVCCSGFYVRSGIAPNRRELAEFIEKFKINLF